jgi:hypothetical protein
MRVPLEWLWQNDPERLPDDDHARCIAAPGERVLVRLEQVFKLTTRPCSYLAASNGARSTVSFSTLRLEYAGSDWTRGLVTKVWSSDPFDSGPFGSEAQQYAGRSLLATVAGALAAA